MTDHPAFWPTLFAVPALLMIAATEWSVIPLLLLAFYLVVVGIVHNGRNARKREHDNRRTARGDDNG